MGMVEYDPPHGDWLVGAGWLLTIVGYGSPTPT